MAAAEAGKAGADGAAVVQSGARALTAVARPAAWRACEPAGSVAGELPAQPAVSAMIPNITAAQRRLMTAHAIRRSGGRR